MGKRSRNLDGLYDIRRMDKIIRIELTAMGAESNLLNKNCWCGHKILPRNTEPRESTLNVVERKTIGSRLVMERNTMVVTE
jgi:hypothetical protein